MRSRLLQRLADIEGYQPEQFLVFHLGQQQAGSALQQVFRKLALRFHELIEDHARRHPAQYLWTYKRFKRPDDDPYRR